eukprot:COSAG02_NODE_2274_length_9257_cov_21.945840_2_plen_510_part_00
MILLDLITTGCDAASSVPIALVATCLWLCWRWRAGATLLLTDLYPPTVAYPEDELHTTEGHAGHQVQVANKHSTGRPTDGRRRCLETSQKCNDGAGMLFAPLRLRGLTLRNRVVKAAAFEAGCDRSGVPLPSLIEHHREAAAGGAALTTVAYAAVSADGRSFATQLLLTRTSAVREGLMQLVRAVHSEGGAVAVQLTHAGSFAKPHLTGLNGRQIAPSAIFNPAEFNWAREMTRSDMRRIVSDFATAAALATECGADAIEVHLGHGYLLSQFLSPYSNRRSDEYGGPIGNRMRFPLQVLHSVRTAVGSNVPLLVKFNLGDGFAGGQPLGDAIELAKAMHEQGVGGWITRNGLFMLRGDVALREMILAQPAVTLRWSLRLFGRFYVPSLAWKPHFFDQAASELLRILPANANVCLLGGLSSRRGMESALAKGFRVVSVARMLLREPDIVHRMQRQAEAQALALAMGSQDIQVSEEDVVSQCSHCNLCIVESAMAERPVRCVERDIEDVVA